MRKTTIMLTFILVAAHAQELADSAQVTTPADSVQLAVDSVAVAPDTNVVVQMDSAAVGDSLAVQSDSDTTAILTEAGETDTVVAGEAALVPEIMLHDSILAIIKSPGGNIPPELSYGYKGYQWGSTIDQIPRLEFADSVLHYDSTLLSISATLGPDKVQMTYFYADSGFWKIEIVYRNLGSDVDSQIDQFLRIEKSISEIYGVPANTNQIFSGPSPSYNDPLDVNFARVFYRSSWAPIPARIELLLTSNLEQTAMALPVFSGDFSTLRLVYYNPDYLYHDPDYRQAREVPSIFEIY